jgi:hypothetical protein
MFFLPYGGDESILCNLERYRATHKTAFYDFHNYF